MADLAALGVSQLNYYEPKVVHTLNKVVSVERQVQVTFLGLCHSMYYLANKNSSCLNAYVIVQRRFSRIQSSLILITNTLKRRLFDLKFETDVLSKMCLCPATITLSKLHIY